MNKLELQTIRFLKSGFKKGNFTNLIYEAMYIHSNVFIAHFNKHWFYKVRFKDPEGFELTMRLLSKLKRDSCERIVLGSMAREFLTKKEL